METYSTWETILIGAFAVLIIFWFSPGIKAALARSRQSEGQWSDAIKPLVWVVLFVIFLIIVTRTHL